jgi:hypothetical protein
VGLFRRNKKGTQDMKNETSGRRRSPTRGNLYADDPIDPRDDQLDRGRLAEQLTRSIKVVAEQSDSAVVALIGPWGSGKSSLLVSIEENLKLNGWHLAHHNPWAYSSYETSVSAFFAEIRDAVPDEIMGPDRRKAWGEWVGRLAPAGSLGMLAGVNASGAMQSAASLISGDRSPEKLRKIAEESLASLEQPILVILDDLDRLQPDELLLTFKLVRLTGRLPNVYYLLAYDEETLSEVLKHTQLIGSDPGRARQYLEKMVQVRLDIPPMLEGQQISLVNRGIDGLCDTHGITLGPNDQERLQSAWSECLVRYLDQPRATKRLFTQVDALWPEVEGEVDFVDFLLITFLRTFERDVYDLVIAHKDELLESPTRHLAARDEPHPKRWERWRKILSEEARPRHPESVLNLLSQLFLYLRSARENMTYSGAFREDVRRRLGVDSEDFFDRYTQVGVPVDDIADKLVSQAVMELRDGQFGPSMQQLEGWLERDAAKVIRKLSRIDEQAPIPAEPILKLLGGRYLSMAEQTSGFLGIPADRLALIFALNVLRREHPDSVLSGLEFLSSKSRSELALAADLVRKAKHADTDVYDTWLAGGMRLVSAALEAHLRSASAQPLSDVPDISRFLYAFWDLRGRESSHTLLWELLGTDAWQLDDLLAALVPIGQGSNGRQTWDSMGDLEAGNIDELLGLDRVLQEIPAVGRDAASDDDDDRRGVTFERRKQRALRQIEHIRTAHSSDTTREDEG